MKVFSKIVGLLLLASTSAAAQSVTGLVSQKGGDVDTRTSYVAKLNTKVFGLGFHQLERDLASGDVSEQEVFGSARVFGVKAFGSLAVDVKEFERDKVAYFLPVSMYGVSVSPDSNATVFARRSNYSEGVSFSTLGGKLDRQLTGIKVGVYGDVSELNGLDGDRPYTAGIAVSSNFNTRVNFRVFGQTAMDMITSPNRKIARVRELGLNTQLGPVLLGGSVGSEESKNGFYRAHIGVRLGL